VEIRFTPEKDDALNVLRAVSTPQWGMFLFVLLLALLFLVGIYLIDHDFALAGYIWLTMSAAIGIATYEVPRIQARRAIRLNPSAQGEIVFTFEDEGINAIVPTGRSQLEWRAYTKFKETDHLFLLFFSPSRYSYIPKRVMSQQDIQQLRGLLKLRVHAS
jgi:hypothetical protein